MELLNVLEKTFTAGNKLTMEELKEKVISLGDLVKEVLAYCTEPKKLPYGRNVLLLNDDYEIIVVYLPGNRATAIHDHGESMGCTFVVQGEFLNRSYLANEYGYPGQNNESLIKEGDILEVPYGQIHEMINPRKEAMISLHVYTPALRSIKVYTPYCEVLDYVI
ncbi:cysteine dioxygenase family protein [Paenibacillus sp. GP183]|uniref:cysteine dioxygenase n=1 Tax=Paenibacillus sp. GP183 TaxID=1882751 RepID=UPI0014959DF6|nr:cysteine dioxygenase family protein [Paenibacillus sp. GP183]